VAKITTQGGFDSELLDAEVAEPLEPLLEWINGNAQIVSAALDGGLTAENMALEYVTLKASSGIRQSFKSQRLVQHVTLSRVVSQVDSGILATGFNWWPTVDGFDYVATYTGDKTDRDVVLRVEYEQ
jgi:hypothetical protein